MRVRQYLKLKLAHFLTMEDWLRYMNLTYPCGIRLFDEHYAEQAEAERAHAEWVAMYYDCYNYAMEYITQAEKELVQSLRYNEDAYVPELGCSVYEAATWRWRDERSARRCAEYVMACLRNL